MILKNVRLSWAQFLFEPEEFNGDAKFKISVIIPKNHPQIAELKAAIVKAIKSKFTSAEGLTNPLVDCDQSGASAAHPYLTNCYTLRLYTKKPPKVTDRAGKAITEADGVIYPGCYVDIDVSFKAWDINGSKSLGRYFNSVQFVNNGTRLGGQSASGNLYNTAPEANSPYLKGYAMYDAPQPEPPLEEHPIDVLNRAMANDEDGVFANIPF